MKKDVFFGFLDNEAYDFMGSNRLIYDLNNSNLARYTNSSLGWKHLYAVVELGEVGLPKTIDNKVIYYLTADSAIQNLVSLIIVIQIYWIFFGFSSL